MKLNLSFYVPFGPVGHPEAAPLLHLVRQDREDLEGELYSYLCKRSSQNSIPTTFFDEDKSLEDNGYHIVQVSDGEISDEELAALPRPAMFTPAPQGTLGRRLQDFRSHIPGFYQHFDFEVWTPGKADCDHDFGLESYRNAYKDRATGEQISEEESWSTSRDIDYYVTVTCTRCGAVHALQEREVP